MPGREVSSTRRSRGAANGGDGVLTPGPLLRAPARRALGEGGTAAAHRSPPYSGQRPWRVARGPWRGPPTALTAPLPAGPASGTRFPSPSRYDCSGEGYGNGGRLRPTTRRRRSVGRGPVPRQGGSQHQRRTAAAHRSPPYSGQRPWRVVRGADGQRPTATAPSFLGPRGSRPYCRSPSAVVALAHHLGDLRLHVHRQAACGGLDRAKEHGGTLDIAQKRRRRLLTTVQPIQELA